MRVAGFRGDSLVAVLLIFAINVATFAAPPDPELQAAKQAFQREMRKKSATARVAAVTKLGELKQAETAELLLKKAMADDDATVRQAGRTALAGMVDERAVFPFLMDELKRAFRKTQPSEHTIEVFRAIVTTKDDSRQTDILKLMDEYLSSAKGSLLIPIVVIDDLAEQGDSESARIVKFLSRSKAFDANFGYRRCVVQAMCQIRQPEAVDFLIDLMPKTQGLVQHDLIQYLTRLTKQSFRDNDRNWTKWWQDNRKEFKFPAAGVALPDATLEEQGPSYYGIPICAKRIVFVLDTSGSMRGLPIDAAKQALLKAVESLPEAVAFNLIMFDNDAYTWQPRLVPASNEAKQLASRVIIERGLRLGTASNAALNAAFDLEPEAIYFLSDGEPTDGAPAQIVSAITQLNRTRRVSIHTIGVVTQRNGGIGLTLFMQPLATKNWGTFRLVE